MNIKKQPISIPLRRIKHFSLRDISANLFVYGTMHFLVDAISVAVLFSIFYNHPISRIGFVLLIFFYDIWAFAPQAFYGLLVDHFKTPRLATLSGCVLVGISALTFLSLPPIVTVILVGLGNALFHVGGGSISLNLTPKKATAPGIFVAPGAIGVFYGNMIKKGIKFTPWPFILPLFILCILMFVVKKPKMDYRRQKISKNKFNYYILILLLVLISILIRSHIGMVLVLPWKSNIYLAVILTAAVVLGKGLGGVIADKFGWMRVAVGTLILSLPLLSFSADFPYLAIPAIFLFNITMSITLIIISNILPGRPGFAFGLACLAIAIGTIPAFSPLRSFFSGDWLIFSAILFSTIVLYLGLRTYYKKFRLPETV